MRTFCAFRRINPVLAVLCLFATAANLRAADHPVATQAELNKAIVRAQPGDAIVIANGTYSDLAFNLTCRGSAEAPVTVRAATPGDVTLNGESHVVIRGSYIVVEGFKFDQVQAFSKTKGVRNVVRFLGATHCRLTQCYFYRCGWNKWAHIVQLNQGSCDNRVDHNTWEKIRGQGVGISHSETGPAAISARNQIDHNYFNRTEALDPENPEKNGNEPIQLGQGKFGDEPMAALVEFNLIENMHARDGADPELISVKTGDDVIRYNTFRHNDRSREITLRYAQRCRVEGNFVLGSGIRVYGSHHVIINNYIADAERGINVPGADGTNYPVTTDVLIANNTIIDPHTAGISLQATVATPLTGVTLKNNLVQGGLAGSKLYYRDAAVTRTTAVANLGYNTAHATVSPPSPNDFPLDITTDPRLTPVNGILKLPRGVSPAKAAGAAIAEVTTDLDGQPRSSPMDIGADTYLDTAPLRRALMPSDVGPAWLGGPPRS